VLAIPERIGVINFSCPTFMPVTVTENDHKLNPVWHKNGYKIYALVAKMGFKITNNQIPL
jgi:hypothetical protein